MKVYDNKMNDAVKKEMEESGEIFLFAENIPAKMRLFIGYKLSVKAYGYTLENVPKLDKTIFSMRKNNIMD